MKPTISLDSLKSAYKRGHLHIIGRTAYRTAIVKEQIGECDRDDFKFIEDLLPSKDNHVVVIFQVLYGDIEWDAGTYYAFLHDRWCIIGKEIVYEEF